VPEPIRSPLAGFHQSLGANFSEYHGALVPERFTDPAAEHRAVRRSVGLFDFSFRSRYVMEGPDRAKFLQRIVSNDVKNLAPGQGTYATLLTPQGHIVADFRICCTEESFIFDTDADLLEKALAGLKRYVIADRVTVEPLDAFALSVQGVCAREALERVLGKNLPAPADFGHFTIESAGNPVRVIQASSTGDEGYEIWSEPARALEVWKAFSESVRELDGQSCGTVALESLRIEAGIPRYGDDFGEDTIPLEAGLLNALSFNKGCYIGQEIVERTRSRGHVNWKLVGLTIDAPGAPAAGEKVLSEGKEIGEITSSCLSPTLAKTLALAYVRREASDPGTRLTLATGSAAQVAVLPFYRSRQGFCG
jgi:glycine cleavage system T protein